MVLHTILCFSAFLSVSPHMRVAKYERDERWLGLHDLLPVAAAEAKTRWVAAEARMPRI